MDEPESQRFAVAYTPAMFSRPLLSLFLSTLINPAVFGTEASQLPTSSQASGLSLAVFDIDATPPIGSMMAYDPVTNKWDLGLRARGIVLLGARLNFLDLVKVRPVIFDGAMGRASWRGRSPTTTSAA